MNRELSLEWRILGGSVDDALDSIRRTDCLETLEALLMHERQHMNRKTVTGALVKRIRKVGAKDTL